MITPSSFGNVDGRPAHSFVIDGDEGVSVRLTDFGARLVALWVPGRDGRAEDVVLGFDDAESYARSSAYFGATVGRYGNRIARGRFTLLGTEYLVDVNEGANHLHGGRLGWDRRLWDAEIGTSSITFRTTSSAGEMGFPGACAVSSTYELRGRILRITLEAVPTETTVINMVHHSYFNLAGHGSGSVLNQHLRLPSDFYVPVDDQLLPTGEILSVDRTRFDFRHLRPIGAVPDVEADAVSTASAAAGDYDHNWCLRAGSADLTEAAEAYDPDSGRRMRLLTSEPGVQVYTGGAIPDRIVGKAGTRYHRYAGFTLETQKFPDSPRLGHFPTSTVRAGEAYRHDMLFEFSAD